MSLIRPTGIAGVEGRMSELLSMNKCQHVFYQNCSLEAGMYCELPFGFGVSRAFLRLPYISCSYGRSCVYHFTNIKHNSLREGRLQIVKVKWASVFRLESVKLDGVPASDTCVLSLIYSLHSGRAQEDWRISERCFNWKLAGTAVLFSSEKWCAFTGIAKCRHVKLNICMCGYLRKHPIK